MEFLFIFLIVLNVFLAAALAMATFARRQLNTSTVNVDQFDAAVAKRLGISEHQVKRQRERRRDATMNAWIDED